MKLKIRRVLTESQIKRAKLSGAFFLCILFAQMLCGTVTNAVEEGWPELKKFEGPYVWQGHEFLQFKRFDMEQGYIDEYTSLASRSMPRSAYCHS